MSYRDPDSESRRWVFILLGSGLLVCALVVVFPVLVFIALKRAFPIPEPDPNPVPPVYGHVRTTVYDDGFGGGDSAPTLYKMELDDGTTCYVVYHGGLVCYPEWSK